VIFAVPTFVSWRRSASPDSASSPTRAIVGGAGWTFVGLLLAICIAVILKDAGASFVTVR